MSHQPVRAHVFISGRVQGVFFRYEAKAQAARVAVAGWVRNTPDERVEAVFEGDKDAVESLIAWCRKGPSLAMVDNVSVEWEEAVGERSFFVR